MDDQKRVGAVRGGFRRIGGVVALVLVSVGAGAVAATPAGADTNIDGCDVVANPTPTHYTECSGMDLQGAVFEGDLSYADFSDANLTDVWMVDENLTDANFAGATFTDGNVALSDLDGVNFTDTVLGTDFNFGDTNLDPSYTVYATSPAGAYVTTVPQGPVVGLSLGGCTLASGEYAADYAINMFWGTCTVTDAFGNVGSESQSIDVFAALTTTSITPAIAEVEPKTHLYLLKLSATVHFTTLDDEAPISGGTVEFDTFSPSYGCSVHGCTYTTTELCIATTNSAGVATCSVSVASLAALQNLVNENVYAIFYGNNWIGASGGQNGGVQITPNAVVDDPLNGTTVFPSELQQYV